ncbi:unnamed protein product [Auanema sp. JU1783]|nr:unnamed protein product [Auanema sp. JU1783]
MTITVLADQPAFQSFIKGNGINVVHFSATWAPSCEGMNSLLEALVTEYRDVNIATIDAEGVSKVSLQYKIAAAPTVLFFKDSKEVGRVNGYIPAEIRQKVIELTTGVVIIEAGPTNLNEKLEKLVKSHKLMIFIKGTPDQPRCGFSRQLVEMFNSHSLDYGSFDILSDEEVRQGLKEFSNWPTYPQVYHNGELLGGLDVIRDEFADADFLKSLPKKGESSGSSDVDARLKSLVNSHKLMLFIKGNPQQPRCGFSRQTIELLNNINAVYGTFDILDDEEVRQNLKTYSNWPTYPQIYLDGELIGGLDVLREELNDKEFVDSLPKKA